MKIFDCFLFCGEIDILRARLELYKNIVYKFVIVEGSVDFRGNPKKAILDNDFLSKHSNIRYFRLNSEDFKVDNAWQREFTSRNCFKKGLSDALDNDLIIISDVDEIISPTKLVKEAKGIRVYEMSYHRFTPNYQCITANWKHACSFPAKYLKNYSPQEMRLVYRGIRLGEIKVTDSFKLIRQAGAHLSYFPISKEISIYQTIKDKIPKHPEDHVLTKHRSFKVTPKYFYCLTFLGIDILGARLLWGISCHPFIHFSKDERLILDKHLKNNKMRALISCKSSYNILSFATSIEKITWRLVTILVAIYGSSLRILIKLFYN
ncbi:MULTISPECIES: beta-1,4-N-acetylglucosaminyltransferase [Prochlorococcus]|uniref:Beta-1,4-N-acetylglucosaminyltransferase-like protein n=1 Tax=Prochlorococcus marinus (strain SARG / CCMP1375 / SS120) TaxID=167539 RepID=Q7VAW9_PROMA|nr:MULTISPECIES: beta-1,4-N-acetylglucosaminyltransferase [Prochlorococcus]AAQ00378.1 beta-1,4-N-acetylglucosaminyltransferase-like protein [Prochlorococcus marinus subsp. marinus str. CCMP1375]KGG14258.1 putative N-acetylglucosaminyltransferase [Prochlorococcus marinus str. LG]KGG22169.1 putative N-acetylglucosaminyltransferase [Prochlorococcus marinus str. SS2]KGG24513.1 putative N-acetylglucosaminyltransferase [Prochlorococcus marinus str. SS35]KGG33408.1 putative N-acetylglucosaminyltransf